MLNADKVENQYGSCFYNRISPKGAQAPLDWQLTDQERLDYFIGTEMVEYLSWLINTPLGELGNNSEIWQCCGCQRDRCELCWVEKNRWEAKDEF